MNVEQLLSIFLFLVRLRPENLCGEGCVGVGSTAQGNESPRQRLSTEGRTCNQNKAQYAVTELYYILEIVRNCSGLVVFYYLLPALMAGSEKDVSDADDGRSFKAMCRKNAAQRKW